MKAEFEKYHLIDNYLRGELKGEELEAFEKGLLDDYDLVEDVEFQREVNEMISANSYHELRQQMSKDIKQIDQRTSFKKWVGGSLILAVLCSSVAYFIFYGKQDEKKVERVTINNSTHQISATSKIENKEVEKVRKENSPKSTSIQKLNSIVENNSPTVIPENPLQSLSELKQVLVEKNELKEPKSEEKSAVQAEINLCNSVKIKAPYTLEKACSQKKDGKFILEENSVSGGKEPYVIELYQGTFKITENEYNQLLSGEYNLKVTDKNGCSDSWKIVIGERSCKAKEVSIHPAYGEKVEFDGNEGESYYLTIYNQAGQLIFKSGLLSGNTEWTGINNSGSIVGTGLYVYIVEYTNGKKETGQITVIE